LRRGAGALRTARGPARHHPQTPIRAPPGARRDRLAARLETHTSPGPAQAAPGADKRIAPTAAGTTGHRSTRPSDAPDSLSCGGRGRVVGPATRTHSPRATPR